MGTQRLNRAADRVGGESGSQVGGYACGAESDELNRATDFLGSRAERQRLGAGRQEPGYEIGFRGLGRELAGSALQSKGLAVQRKLVIGTAGDKYEREADRVAADVVARIHGLGGAAQPAVQRIGETDKDALRLKPMVQLVGTEGGAVSADLERAIRQARGGGKALSPAVREKMGQAMGADFREVRVHSDARADALTRAVQARALTTGRDIFFRRGEYAPSSRGGQTLIAHELTHVMQQHDNRISRTVIDKDGKPMSYESVINWLESNKYKINDVAKKTVKEMVEHPTELYYTDDVTDALDKIMNSKPNLIVMVPSVSEQNIEFELARKYLTSKKQASPNYLTLGKRSEKRAITSNGMVYIVSHGDESSIGDMCAEDVSRELIYQVPGINSCAGIWLYACKSSAMANTIKQTMNPQGYVHGTKGISTLLDGQYIVYDEKSKILAAYDDFNADLKDFKERIEEDLSKGKQKQGKSVAAELSELLEDWPDLLSDTGYYENSNRNKKRFHEAIEKIFAPGIRKLTDVVTLNPETFKNAWDQVKDDLASVRLELLKASAYPQENAWESY